MAENTMTLGIEVRVEGAAKAGTDLAAVDAAVKKVGSSLGSVSRFAGTSGLDRTVAGLRALGVNVNTSSRHVQNLAVSMQRVARERAFQALASDANLSAMQLARLRAGLGDTQGAFSTLVSGAKRAALGVAAAGTAATAAAKVCFDAALQADRLSKAYTTIAGSAQGAEKQLAFIRETSSRLGQEFYGTAEAAKTFFAAGKGTSLEKDLNNIFEGVSEAGTALALSQEEMNGIYLALGQMISKGKVQAEELRGQLGERLPGAFQLAAKAMGMTTAELDKALQKGDVLASDLLPRLADTLKNEFGGSAVNAANGAQGAVNRLATAWTDLKASIGDSQVIIDAINSVTSGLKALAEYSNLRSVSETFAQGASLAREGRLNFEEFTRAGFAERQNMVDRALNPKNQVSGKLSFSPPPELRTAPAGKSASGAGTAARQAEAAARAIQQVYEEIERLNGTGGEFGYELTEKLRDIARNGKAAGVSLEEIEALQSAWSQAAIKKHYDDISAALRDADIEIARMNEDQATLNRLEKERDLEQQRDRLLSLGVAQDEVNAKMEEYAAALEKSRGRNTQNLETVNSVLKELEEKTGQYGLSLETSNRLLETQVQLWKQAGVPEEFIEQLREIRELENSTDAWAGISRATSQYYAEATNLGKQFESFTTGMFSSFEDAFTRFVTTGKLSFTDLANSIISDLVRISVQAMVVAPIAKGLSGFFSGFFGGMSGGFSGGLFGGSSGGASAGMFDWSNSISSVTGGFSLSRRGNVFSGGDLSDFSDRVITQPQAFSYGTRLTRYAKGAGLMGEAGPEAVMPLVRASGGYLGVRSVGGAAPNVTVNLINNSKNDLEASASAQSDGKGGWNIEIMLDQIESGLVKRDAAGRSALMNHVDRTRGISRAGGLYR